MEEELKVELERLKMTNYILQKENEILLGTISMVTADKEDLIKQLEIAQKTLGNRIIRKVKNILRRQ